MDPLDPLSWRDRAVGDFFSSSVVCSVTGCGSSHGKDEKGGDILWGMWVCNKHLHAVQARASEMNNPPSSSSKELPLFPPPQPVKVKKEGGKKGRGGSRVTPAAKGVSVEDILFMTGMVRDSAKTKARTQQYKSESEKHKKEANDLEKRLETERAHAKLLNAEICRLRIEGNRQTLENQVRGWKKKAQDASEKVAIERKKSKAAVAKANKERDSARRDKNGFVQDLQKRMEIGGVKMYCIERGNEGMFVPEDQMHAQLKAWEEQQEESWEQMKKMKEKFLKVVTDLRTAEGSLSMMECHASALEQAVRAIAVKGKREQEQLSVKIAKAVKEKEQYKSRLQVEKEKAGVDIMNSEEAVSKAKAEISSIESALERARTDLHDSSRRHEDQVQKLRKINERGDKHRKQAIRAKEKAKKDHNKSWKKVGRLPP